MPGCQDHLGEDGVRNCLSGGPLALDRVATTDLIHRATFQRDGGRQQAGFSARFLNRVGEDDN